MFTVKLRLHGTERIRNGSEIYMILPWKQREQSGRYQCKRTLKHKVKTYEKKSNSFPE